MLRISIMRWNEKTMVSFAELLRIYKSLDLRGRLKLLDVAVSLEEAAEKSDKKGR